MKLRARRKIGVDTGAGVRVSHMGGEEKPLAGVLRGHRTGGKETVVLRSASADTILIAGDARMDLRWLLVALYLFTGTTNADGGWQQANSIDQLTGQKKSTLQLRASSGASKYGDPIYFVARCQGGDQWDVYIRWGQFVGLSGDLQTIRYRFDDEKIRTKYSSISTDGKATFFSTGWGFKRFIRSLFGANKFVVATQPYGDGRRTATFFVRGAEKAFQAALLYCAS